MSRGDTERGAAERRSGLHRIGRGFAAYRETLLFYHDILDLRLVADSADDHGMGRLNFGFDRYAAETLRFTAMPASGFAQAGPGKVDAFSLLVPPRTINYWRERLIDSGVEVLGRAWAFDEEHLCFTDPAGLNLSIVEIVGEGGRLRAAGEPRDHAIRGIRSIEIRPRDIEAMGFLFSKVLGFVSAGNQGLVTRYRRGPLAVDFLELADASQGVKSTGPYDYLAWRLPPSLDLLATRAALTDQGFHVSSVTTLAEHRRLCVRERNGVTFDLLENSKASCES